MDGKYQVVKEKKNQVVSTMIAAVMIVFGYAQRLIERRINIALAKSTKENLGATVKLLLWDLKVTDSILENSLLQR